MHEVGPARFREETYVVRLQQLRFVLLDDQGSSHGLNIDYALKVRPALVPTARVPVGTSLVILFGQRKQSLVQMHVTGRKRYGVSWVKVIVFSN